MLKMRFNYHIQARALVVAALLVSASGKAVLHTPSPRPHPSVASDSPPLAEGQSQNGDTLKSRKLGEVTVSASAKQKDLQNAAPSQTLTARDMEQMGVQQLSDAVKHLSGVTLHDYGGAGGLKTVSIRGLGARFTGVSYDGVALSDVQTGQIDLQRYTLNGIQQVNLLVGEGSDIFISAREATMPSFLSIETEKVKSQESRVESDNSQSSMVNGQCSMVLGSWGYTNPMVSGSAEWGKLAVSAMADYIYAENDYPFTIYNITERIHKRRVHSKMNQGHAEINARYTFSANHMLTAKAYYYDNDRDLPGVVRYYTSESKQQLRERTAFGQILYRGRLSDQWSLKAAAKWNFASSEYEDRLYQNGVMDGSYWQREGYLSGAVLFRPIESLSFSYASDIVHNDLNSHRYMVTDQHPSRLSLLNTLSARWNRGFLSLSARVLHSAHLEHVRTGAEGQDYHHWSPSASASAKLGRGWTARVMWKDIFRMPSFTELYYYHLGTQDLKPERTSQWNAGLTWEGKLLPTLSATMSSDLYINKVKDKIISIPYNLFVWRNVNAAETRVKGLDLNLSLTLRMAMRHALEMQGHYSYMHAVDRSLRGNNEYNKQLPYMPRHSGSAVLTWRNPWVNVSLNAYGVSKTWATKSHADGSSIGGYGELGTTLFREFSLRGKQKLTASFNLSNLLNKQYEVIAAYPMPGRAWRAKVTYLF